METEQKKKVAELNEDPMKNEEEIDDGSGGGNEISGMDKLPNEILMKILEYLDEKQLVKCRLLASRWNEISCLLLQDKSKNNSESRLVVQLREDMKCQIVITKSLEDFLKCFGPPEAEKSSGCRRPFPFSSFFVSGLATMNIKKMCEFVSTFGPRMKAVTVNISSLEIWNFQIFWKLLLEFAPNVQQLKISGDSSLKNVILFGPVVKAMNLNDTFLKKLIKLEIESFAFGHFNDFMKDLLDNAPNLQQVSSSEPHPHGNYTYAFQDLEVWQKLNRAHLLKKLEIQFNSHSNLSPAQLMKNLRLVNFRAGCSVPYYSKTFVTNYINHALKSSQDTLSSLDLYGLFAESMKQCFEDIKSLPNVRRLRIHIQIPIDNILERFSQVCPNITNLDLEYYFGGDFSQVTRVLWTGFKGLKSLKFSLQKDNNGRRYHLTLDSAISGYSEESIGRIQSKLGQGIPLEEARQGEPQNPSIADLKGLRELEVGVIHKMNQGHNLEDQVENSLFFKLLPQLHTKKVWVRNEVLTDSDSSSDSSSESDD